MKDKFACDKADPSYKSCMRVFAKDAAAVAAATAPSSVVVSVRKHTLANRIKQYHYLRDKLSLLRHDDCLEARKFADGTSGYTIRDIINLNKKIGSKSRYGLIYLTSIPSLANTFPIVTKVMPYNMNNLYEVKMMSMITREILLQGLSRHFLLTYGDSVCSKRIAKKLKLININELADGDIKMMIHIPEVVGNAQLMFNIFIQIYISIATFHNLVGHVHRDTHYGNFLYQTNNEKGYYHYRFHGVSYYLKACKYNIMIYDYGFARRISTYDRNTTTVTDTETGIGTYTSNSEASKCKISIYKDYAKIINAFIKKSSNGWNELSVLDKKLSDKMNAFRMLLLTNIEYEIYNKHTTECSSFASSMFAFIIEEIFLKYAPKGMFITTRPPKVINAIPFQIDNIY